MFWCASATKTTMVKPTITMKMYLTENKTFIRLNSLLSSSLVLLTVQYCASSRYSRRCFEHVGDIRQ